MKEIRLHGRGGQGVVKASHIVVKAAVSSGIDTYVANGRKSVLAPLLAGKPVGTFFPGSAL